MLSVPLEIPNPHLCLGSLIFESSWTISPASITGMAWITRSVIMIRVALGSDFIAVTQIIRVALGSDFIAVPQFIVGALAYGSTECVHPSTRNMKRSFRHFDCCWAALNRRLLPLSINHVQGMKVKPHRRGWVNGD